MKSKPKRSSSQLVKRGLIYLLAISIAMFILIPIYLITLSAFSTSDVIYSYPKPLLPSEMTLDTVSFFLGSLLYKI